MLMCSLLTRLRRAINLTKNSQFYVRQGDVERLIQQGYLQKLS
jgi:GINS complex subunit 1